jgi:FtsP/CotA-like multicopper oxidase with cupredoxin domain
MPEYPIVITGPIGAVKFDLDPQPVDEGDLVFWSNQSDVPHTIVIDEKPEQPIPAPVWDSSSSYKVDEAVTYRCQDHPNETGAIIIKTAMLLLALLTGLFAPSLTAQVKCGDLIGGELRDITQVDRDPVKSQVRGILVTSGEKQLIAFVNGDRVTGEIKASDIKCVEQWMRTYRKDAPATSQRPDTPATLPQPGPTIRARVGDLVELTFLNLIDRLNFPGTDTGVCDHVQDNGGEIYPKTDTEPNCFHGSVFTNVHFHGTHTSPSSTADNVFLEIVPSPRSKNNDRVPEVTAESVKADFAKFFGACETMLNRNDSPQQWPKIWTDLPESFRITQVKLLSGDPKLKTLYEANLNAIANGAFPQNYVGAFPYCYRLPVYTAVRFPPESMTEARMTHTGGEGSTEHDESLAPKRPLLMGQSPGTHWYHAHKHGSTTLNVSNGMTGALIIEGAYDDEIKKAYSATGITEHVIVLNQIGVTPRREGGNEARQGPYISVNGRLQPTISMRPGEVQMWRIVNTSSRSGAFFQTPTGVRWRQLAQDGVQFTDTNYKASENQPFLLTSGNRADLLVKAPNSPSARVEIKVLNTVGPGNFVEQLLLKVETTSTGGQEMQFMDRSRTSFPPFLTDIKESDVTGRKRMVFATDKVGAAFSNHTIDGKKFTGEVGALVLLNQVEEWTVVNESFGRTAIAHPFHIHINPFQVFEVFDPNEKLADGTTPRYTTGNLVSGQCKIDVKDQSTWKPCAEVPPPRNIWWDVFPIPPGNTFDGVKIPGYFKMRSRFVDYAGYYVLHCHILSHEDRGMMTVVYVAPLQPPFSHH